MAAAAEADVEVEVEVRAPKPQAAGAVPMSIVPGRLEEGLLSRLTAMPFWATADSAAGVSKDAWYEWKKEGRRGFRRDARLYHSLPM